ncbi:MAG: ABC transporter permease, partial [Tannerellaceae bacterium]|jgi:ABC-type antimicrobial peptide transport system permease subunit|nr:ABC transporter permease [Tannerellaceae bacterium]
MGWDEFVLFKFHPGRWEECKQAIETLLREKYPETVRFDINNTEEEFNTFLKSENMLLKLLDCVSIVCLLISIFGIFTLVTLHCEQSRKEISIRKVNGAEAGDIIRMFSGKYLWLLNLASVIAFPAGYLIMKPWLQNYVAQTSMDWWIYPAIWLALTGIVLACIFGRIHQVASANPAETIKTE